MDATTVHTLTLLERARFAHLDHTQERAEHFLNAARAQTEEVLGIPLPSDAKVNDADRSVEFWVEGLRLRVRTTTEKAKSSSGNQHIPGMDEEERRQLYLWVKTDWKDIDSLADLGRWLARIEPETVESD